MYACCSFLGFFFCVVVWNMANAKLKHETNSQMGDTRTKLGYETTIPNKPPPSTYMRKT